MRNVREKLEIVLGRLAERAGDERVFVRLYPQEARDAADAADRRHRMGASLGPLDGAIVSLEGSARREGRTDHSQARWFCGTQRRRRRTPRSSRGSGKPGR